MEKIKNIYPIDIFGVKNVDIEEWLDDYYTPLTCKEFHAIYQNIYSSYFSALKKYNSDIVYWMAISNMKIPNYISQYIAKLLQLLRLREKGIKYIVGRNTVKISDYASDCGVSSLNNINLIGKRMAGFTAREKIKEVLKTIKYNISPSLFMNKNIFKNFSTPSFFMGDMSMWEVIKYPRENGLHPLHLSPMLFAKNDLQNFNNDAQLPEVLKFADVFLSNIQKNFSVLSKEIYELLANEVKECMKYSLLFFRHNVNAFDRIKPENLFVTGLGNQFHRLCCSAIRYAGGEAIGFTHGYTFAFCNRPSQIFYMSLVDKYVVISKGQKRLLMESAENFSSGLKMAAIELIKHNSYYQLYEVLQKSKYVQKIRKVMLVGFPVGSFIYPDIPDGNPLSQLHLEIRLVKLLRQAGYHVIYKPHPMTLNETKEIFKKYADEVLEEGFEEVYDKADCLLFGNHASTTFGFAMFTNKPIVFINSAGAIWNPDVFRLLKKRCSIVDTDVDELNRIIFNEKDILDAVEGSINNINYDILHEFAF